MAGQGLVFKLWSNFSNVKTMLNINRTVLVNYQQQATMKHSAREALKDLNIPEKPKRPLTPYFRFMSEQRPDIAKNNPRMKLMEISKHCSAAWAQVDDAVKEKYSEAFKKDLEEYAVKYLEYKSKLSKEQVEAIRLAAAEKTNSKMKRKTKKRCRELNRPKKPISSFMYFLIELGKVENKKLSELMMTIKGKWAELPESEKEKYKALYEIDKKRYDLEMGAWETKMIKQGNEDVVRQKSMRESLPSRLKDLKPQKAQ